jgi:hypothetical protein
MYDHGPRTIWDIKDQLFQGLVLREKEFRNYLKDQNWQKFKGHNIAIICSADAIVPTWAYMLLAVNLAPYANHVIFGDLKELEISLFQKALSKLDLTKYKDAKVVIKGCGKIPVPEFAYVELVRMLQGVASSIMYGEPCSTVPLYKKPRV